MFFDKGGCPSRELPPEYKANRGAPPEGLRATLLGQEVDS